VCGSGPSCGVIWVKSWWATKHTSKHPGRETGKQAGKEADRQARTLSLSVQRVHDGIGRLQARHIRLLLLLGFESSHIG
jgi:hypothetical protein